MLKVENQIDRSKLKKYFYINSGSLIRVLYKASLAFFALSITMYKITSSPVAEAFWGIMAFVGVVAFIVSCVLKLSGAFKTGYAKTESFYDEVRKADVAYLRTRAVQVIGLVDEEMSLIDPVVASGFADEDAVIFGKELAANQTKRSIFKRVLDFIFAIPRKIWHFIKIFFFGEEVISQAIFMEGTDKKIRSSLASMEFIAFTEQQVLAYVCQYDVALGIILNEYTREIFYRDIDSVNYGTELLHIWSENSKEYHKIPVEKFRMTISSTNNIWASLIGEENVLGNQITAVKALVRSKKEEMK